MKKLAFALVLAVAFAAGSLFGFNSGSTLRDLPGWRRFKLWNNWETESSQALIFSQQAAGYWQAFYEGVAYAKAQDADAIIWER